jgi:hypothetical protein
MVAPAKIYLEYDSMSAEGVLFERFSFVYRPHKKGSSQKEYDQEIFGLVSKEILIIGPRLELDGVHIEACIKDASKSLGTDIHNYFFFRWTTQKGVSEVGVLFLCDEKLCIDNGESMVMVAINHSEHQKLREWLTSISRFKMLKPTNSPEKNNYPGVALG